MPATHAASQPLPAETTVAKMAYSVDEVCEALGLSRPSVYDLIRSGMLRSKKLGGRRVIPVTELERLLAADD
jgi:excisionase family DNA binding protein